MTGCTFVARSWERDEVLIRDTFSRIRTEKLPFWVVNFAEGTHHALDMKHLTS